MKESEILKFYRYGIYTGKFKNTPKFKLFYEELKKLYNGEIRPNYSFEKKYSNSIDFRPSISDYNDVFFEILKENNIHNILETLTGKDLYCIHTQLRKTLPGKAYLRWHRDAYFHNSSKTGNLPPVFKIIYYPNFNEIETKQLEVSLGSQRRNINNKYLDYLNNIFFPKKKIFSNKFNFILFDTTIFHKVFREKNKSGSFRLIYTFGTKNQFSNYSTDSINNYKKIVLNK